MSVIKSDMRSYETRLMIEVKRTLKPATVTRLQVRHF